MKKCSAFGGGGGAKPPSLPLRGCDSESVIPTENLWIRQTVTGIEGTEGTGQQWYSMDVKSKISGVSWNCSVHSVTRKLLVCDGVLFIDCWRSWREAATSVGRRCQWNTSQRRGNRPVQAAGLRRRTVRQGNTVRTEEAGQWTNRSDFELAFYDIDVKAFKNNF